jgi:NAD(P)-dependent dehydrogenase (short-subunit alcohol dehydrogenase family)
MLSEAGHTVTASVLNDAEEAAVRAAGDSADVIRLDLSDPESVLSGLKEYIGTMDRLDGVAVCAAISPLGPLETMPLSLARRTFEVNVLAELAVFQATLAALRDSGGRLVMVSSMSGKASLPFVGAYSASKYALEALGDAMRREVSAQGVAIALVLPGGIKTPMVENQLRDNAAAIERLSPEEDARYGGFYRGFQKAAHESHHVTASPPQAVAAAVISGLLDAEPKPRYIVGADAEQLIGAAASLGDAEMDAMFREMFAL